MNPKKLLEALSDAAIETSAEEKKSNLKEGINSDTVSKKFFAMLTDTLEDFEEDEDENLTEDDRARILAVLLNAEAKKNFKTSLWRNVIEKLYQKGNGGALSKAPEQRDPDREWATGVTRPSYGGFGGKGGFNEAAPSAEFFTTAKGDNMVQHGQTKPVSLADYRSGVGDNRDIYQVDRALKAKMTQDGYDPDTDYETYVKKYLGARDDKADVFITRDAEGDLKSARYDQAEIDAAKKDEEYWKGAIPVEEARALIDLFAAQERGLREGLGRKFNKAMSFGGETTDGTPSTPDNIVRRVQGYSDKDLQMLLGDGEEGGEGSARGFQMQTIKRELKRRGLLSEGYKEGVVKEVDYKGYTITLFRNRGGMYTAKNDSGEPYTYVTQFETPEEAIAWDKKNIDQMEENSPRKGWRSKLSEVMTDREREMQKWLANRPNQNTNKEGAASAELSFDDDAFWEDNDDPDIEMRQDDAFWDPNEDDRDISDMPRHNVTDWDDTDDPSFNSDFRESLSEKKKRHMREATELTKYGFSPEFASALYGAANLHHEAEPVPVPKKPLSSKLDGYVLISKTPTEEVAIWRPSASFEGSKGFVQGVRYDKTTREIERLERMPGEKARIETMLPRGEYYLLPIDISYSASSFGTRNRLQPSYRHADTRTDGMPKPHVKSDTVFAADASPQEMFDQLKGTFLPRLQKKADDIIDRVYGAMRYLSTDAKSGRDRVFMSDRKSQAQEALDIVEYINRFLKEAFTARNYNGVSDGLAQLLPMIHKRMQDPDSVLYNMNLGSRKPLGLLQRDAVQINQAMQGDPSLRFELIKNLEGVLNKVAAEVDEMVADARSKRRNESKSAHRDQDLVAMKKIVSMFKD
ncbi:MAG: hypothetical protein LC687_00210 [Actinobacteria bacterium]|nr:hypothetical protein [Actinomycetota bacterium]MCA1806293.1 hypothetical protein [Actinomycetota bacterium]